MRKDGTVDNGWRNADNLMLRMAPLLRGAIAEPSGDDDEPYRRAILQVETGEEALAFVNHKQAEKNRPCPVNTEGCQFPPLWLEATNSDDSAEVLREKIGNAVEKYRLHHNYSPQVFFCPGAGIVTAGSYACANCSNDSLTNKIAVVTGSAGAIGSGICEALLGKGCLVAATDLGGERLDALVSELEKVDSDRVMGVPMDVTDSNSVKKAFEQVVWKWGGVDITVINAGLAMVSGLMEMELEEFRALEKVNVEGTLLVLAEAGRCLSLQGLGGDIVLISTKNVFAPGAQFGAYSATKAAAHQLCRIASLEFAPAKIRVNMVSPDAVFSHGERKSGLWAKVGPDRMRKRGLDEKGLEEYYRSRNLLQAQITARHVANAVLFFVTRQTPTTGATIPVDGGLSDASPR